MIDGLKPYPKMKDSGVPWLGEVPEHWELRRTKTLLRERVEKGHPDQPLLAATQSKGVVRKEQYENRTVLALKDLHLLKLVRVGDFVISLRSFQGGIEYAREQGIISPAYTILYPTRADMHGYLARLFKSAPYIENLSLYVTGIRQGQNIDYEKLARTELPLPPLPEQVAIVRFLDYVDRRIRRYIRAKQKLIKLLEEQKQAIIHRAVTRGLDPNVRLKPSGVEWLGDVPEHWEVRKLRQCGSIYGGLTPSMADRSLWDGDVPWVTPKDMKRFTIAGASMKVAARALETTSLRLIPSGSVLLVVRGMILARRVPIARTVEPVTINQDMKAIVPATGVDAGYLAYRMDAAQTAFVPMIDEAGHGTKRFPTERWKDLSLAMPPVEEQRQIARHLDQATAQVVRALNSAQHEIDLLREYRTRLIADVVTGKLDVREAAARLPDEIEELEPVDEIEAEGDADDAGVGYADEMIEEAET
jgi:type I restriction enzyme S subunit